ncbi:MAG: DUF5317 family protein [Acidimicrobiales bacterium]
MGYTAIAITLGLVAGLVAGGRPANAARRSLRWWPALAGGAAAQWIPELLDVPESAAFAAVVASYAALAAFAVANLGLVGMPVVLLGLVLNIAVILANGGMPVRAEAIIAADIAATPEEIAALDFGSKRHLEDRDDRLTVLGDIVPVPPLREVLSFGDLILAAGVTNVVFRLLRPARSRRRTESSARGDISLEERLGSPVSFAEASVIDLAGEERRLITTPGG